MLHISHLYPVITSSFDWFTVLSVSAARDWLEWLLRFWFMFLWHSIENRSSSFQVFSEYLICFRNNCLLIINNHLLPVYCTHGFSFPLPKQRRQQGVRPWCLIYMGKFVCMEFSLNTQLLCEDLLHTFLLSSMHSHFLLPHFNVQWINRKIYLLSLADSHLIAISYISSPSLPLFDSIRVP